MRICNLELSSLQKFRWRRWGSFFLDLCRLDPPLATIQGGIFPGNLGTGFPGNPWSQAKYLPEITLFLFNIIREEFEGGNQDIIPELFKINDLKSKELFHVK